MKNKLALITIHAFILFAFVSLLSCGPSRHPPRSADRSGGISGSWKVSLKGVSDTCKLGIKGETIPATVVISQRGKAIRLTIQGLGKTYKGTASGTSISASGRYSQSGVSMNGTIRATLKSSKKISITSAVLKLKSKSVDCQITLRGSGKR